MFDNENNDGSTIHLQGPNLTIDNSNFESIQKQDKLEFTSNTEPGCLDVTSVSAVSSLGSEKVQTASEGDWDNGTDSDRENGLRYFTDHYDYSSNTRSFISRHTSAVQKKYHMFGRRCLHEEATQNTIVYSKMQILNSQESFLDCYALVNSAFLNFEEQDESNSGSTIHLQGANLTIDDSNFESIQKQDKLEFTSNTEPGCLDVTSVSAVSSLRSEKVQTASEGDWANGTDSDRENGRRYFTDHYDYSSNTRSFISRHTSAVQKKYHMFGRRCLHEEATQNTIVYSKMQILNSQESFLDCDALVNSAFLNFEEHDVPIGNESNSGLVRDNLDCTNFEFNCHLTRDEKRARNLHVPIPVHDIINLPMDEFNERLSKYDLNENQLSLIRDIRRRGKNKVAAQNCRKRKLDTILSLEGEVQEVRRRKEKLLSERSLILTEKKRIANKFSSLHNLIFEYLRDSEGNLCSPSNFSLQQQPDGSMFLLPRSSSKLI